MTLVTVENERPYSKPRDRSSFPPCTNEVQFSHPMKRYLYDVSTPSTSLSYNVLFLLVTMATRYSALNLCNHLRIVRAVVAVYRSSWESQQGGRGWEGEEEEFCKVIRCIG